MKNGKKQRAAKRLYATQLRNKFKPQFECPNCKEMIQWSHFVPPSLGEDGFFICAQPTTH